MSPQELERKIDAAYAALVSSRSTDQKSKAAADLSRLNKLRSPQRVEQMEKQRGLV